MNNENIEDLIEGTEQLQLSLRQTQVDLNQVVREELNNNQTEEWERARRNM